MSKTCQLLGIKTQFGNNVSHSQRKTRRRFDVNLQKISFKSDILDQTFKLRVASSTIRTVEHNFGFDNFLLTTKAAKLTEKARNLRIRLKKAQQEVASEEKSS